MVAARIRVSQYIQHKSSESKQVQILFFGIEQSVSQSFGPVIGKFG
jgi:hypothetical protein